MKPASSRNKPVTFVSRLAIRSIAGALAISVLGFAPNLRAETPPDQVKAAGAITLTTSLLDKMETVIKNVKADATAKAEMAAADKDPSLTPETWGSVISARCPKAVAIFKAAGVTPDDFAKGMFAIMAVGMNEDMGMSPDKTIQANAAFITANKDRASAVFAAFLTLGDAGPSSSPATP
jgi:hypothetical protein